MLSERERVIRYPTSPYSLASWLLLGSAKKIINEKKKYSCLSSEWLLLTHPSLSLPPKMNPAVLHRKFKKGRRDNFTWVGDIIDLPVLGKPRKNKFDLFIIRSFVVSTMTVVGTHICKSETAVNQNWFVRSLLH